MNTLIYLFALFITVYCLPQGQSSAKGVAKGELSQNMQTLAKHFSVGRYPNNLAYRINRTIPTDIWTEDVRGRLFPLVEMMDRIDVVEYFSGIPPLVPANGYLVKKQVVTGYLEMDNVIAVLYDTHFFFPTAR